MAHVITRPCCNDASCVTVCPVNCIHPTPDEPEFLTAEMLYIDPDTCIDCGACVDECPVEAIFPDDQLDTQSEKYLQINGDYFTDHEVDGGLVPPKKRLPLPAGQTLHVAVVGSGPAAFYTAEELLKHSAVKVDMFDRLPTPYGLVRAGVAPDHAKTKQVEATFKSIANKASFSYLLNVEIGKHLTADELLERYGAVVYAFGASADKPLGIPGDDLAGSISATEFVAWYNGHPDFVDWKLDLSGDRAIVVGNGNVALDVARILVSDPEALAKTDIADHALEALRASNIREVDIVARRGVAQAAYTNQEFLALTQVEGVDVVIDSDDMVLDEATEAALADSSLDSTIATKIRLAREVADAVPTDGNKRVRFRFLTTPLELVGDGKCEKLLGARNKLVVDNGRVSAVPTDETVEIPAGLVMRAVGYTGRPLDGVPFDEASGTIPNEESRVLTAPDGDQITGVYVSGWIKRGATGGIGINRYDGQQTAEAVLQDFIAGKLNEPGVSRDDVAKLAEQRGAHVIDGNGWKAIDAAERASGKAAGRVRVKLVRVTDMESAAKG